MGGRGEYRVQETIEGLHPGENPRSSVYLKITEHSCCILIHVTVYSEITEYLLYTQDLLITLYTMSTCAGGISLYTQKLQDSGAVCKWQELAGKDHFQVSELLQNEDDNVMKVRGSA